MISKIQLEIPATNGKDKMTLIQNNGEKDITIVISNVIDDKDDIKFNVNDIRDALNKMESINTTTIRTNPYDHGVVLCSNDVKVPE